MLGILGAIVISASLDTTPLQLVEPRPLHVRVVQDTTARVQLPNYMQQLPWSFVTEDLKTDTTLLENGQWQIDQHLSIYSAADYQDTVYTIQPFVVAQGDTLYADSMVVRVQMPKGIAKQEEICEIKDVEQVPIWWWDVAKWGVLGIGILLFGVIAYFGIMWYLLRRQPKQAPIDPDLLRPAEEVALEKLDEIKATKKWKDGKVKEYQTELTDVVREYIGRRFGVQSTEKTSDETLKAMRPLLMENRQWKMENSKDLYENLRKMLQLADLVKFAKWHTTPEENESALSTAYEFVQSTTPQAEEVKMED